MSPEELQSLYEDKYAELLGKDFEEWLQEAPQSEDEAYARLNAIDAELKNTEDEYQEATGEAKWELGEYRERLRNEYQLLEELFGLENEDEWHY